MSLWEINNMGINRVLKHLENQELTITAICNIVDIQPQIWFEDKGVPSYVCVRTSAPGHKNNKYIISKELLQDLSDYEGYFADVEYSSASAVLYDGNGDVVPLSKRDGEDDVCMWRGDEYLCNFSGLEKINEAIDNHSFISLKDDPSYII